LWGERYDRELRDVFAVQDEIVETIVRTIVARVERHSLERADRKVVPDLKAYDYVLQARALMCDSADNNRRCRELYESALRVDPHSAAACCGISMTHGLDHTSGWSDSPEESLEQAISYALKAVALDDDSSEAHIRLGSQRLFNREYDLAEFHLDKALNLNPNDAGAWAYKGLYFIYTGKPEDALSALEQATRRNPFHSAWYLWFIGLAYYCSRRYQEAIQPLRRSIDHNPKFIAPRRHLAACYARLGNSEDAVEQTEKILELEPDFSIRRLSGTLCYQNSSDLEHYLGGLRAAGLPD
jgi:Flp pilus assembly protein TadD